jgi:hypothetical protein
MQACSYKPSFYALDFYINIHYAQTIFQDKYQLAPISWLLLHQQRQLPPGLSLSPV